MNIEQVIAGSEMKGKALTTEELKFAQSYLTRLSYRIRHYSDSRQTDAGRPSASYFICQAIMNVQEYLAGMEDA